MLRIQYDTTIVVRSSEIILCRRCKIKTEVTKKNNTEVAVVSSNELLITDVQSALDLIMTVKYEMGCTNIAVNKGAIINDFFVLSTCLAGIGERIMADR